MNLLMIYKVYYQETPTRNIRRENTKSLYIEAENEIEVRKLIDKHTPYNVEYIQQLDENHLNYERENEHFFLTEFK